jgi:hypothetical protein
VIESIKRVVPVVGNTHELQNARSEIGTWFLNAATKVNPRIGSGATAQGFYVFGADGSAYGFNNNRSIERVLAFIDSGLKAFAASQRVAVAIDPLSAPRSLKPADATTLRVYSRISPIPPGCDPANENVQRDHLWLLADEAEQMKRGRVPTQFVHRMLRFSLVDAIRGEPDFWMRNEIVSQSFHMKPPDGGRRTLAGEFSMSTKDGTRGLTGSIELEFRFEGDRIENVIGVAESTAWGRGRWTPNPPSGRFPVRFAFVLPANDASTVVPQAAMYGAEYLAPN